MLLIGSHNMHGHVHRAWGKWCIHVNHSLAMFAQVAALLPRKVH